MIEHGKLVYIAAPYTNGDAGANVHKALKAADVLADLGFLVYVPHLSHFWHVMSPKPKEYWMALDLRILKHCDMILRLPGESAGADKEIAFAEDEGIPIYYELGELLRHERV